MIAKDLRRLSKLYVKFLAQQLPPPHTEYMAEAMLYLGSSEQKVHQKLLAEFLVIDRRSVVAMLDDLIKLQYVSIEKDPDTLKDHLFSLTSSGKAILPKIVEAIKATDDMLRGNMDKRKYKSFFSLMTEMEQNLLKRIPVYNFRKLEG
jgi:DNA-binding MarR family transcriptional regulator